MSTFTPWSIGSGTADGLPIWPSLCNAVFTELDLALGAGALRTRALRRVEVGERGAWLSVRPQHAYPRVEHLCRARPEGGIELLNGEPTRPIDLRLPLALLVGPCDPGVGDSAARVIVRNVGSEWETLSVEPVDREGLADQIEGEQLMILAAGAYVEHHGDAIQSMSAVWRKSDSGDPNLHVGWEVTLHALREANRTPQQEAEDNLQDYMRQVTAGIEREVKIRIVLVDRATS